MNNNEILEKLKFDLEEACKGITYKFPTTKEEKIKQEFAHLASIYGKENVRYNEETDTFTILGDNVKKAIVDIHTDKNNMR